MICGDGCLQEGVTSEASSLAGHLGLGSFIVLYDDNNITIDGTTDLSTSEDIKSRYEATGWHVVSCDGHDFDDIRRALDQPGVVPAVFEATQDVVCQADSHSIGAIGAVKHKDAVFHLIGHLDRSWATEGSVMAGEGSDGNLQTRSSTFRQRDERDCAAFASDSLLASFLVPCGAQADAVVPILRQ